MGGGEVGGHRTFLGTPRSPRAGAVTGGWGQMEKRTATDPQAAQVGRESLRMKGRFLAVRKSGLGPVSLQMSDNACH